MQLTAFSGCTDVAALIGALTVAKAEGALYEDANDPRGVAVLALSEDPAQFLEKYRLIFNRAPFASLTVKPEYSMLGRTYAIGYEPDLEDTLLKRPRRVTLDKAWPWAVWYPLRRTGAFSQLSHQEQGQILKEHGTIGRQFGDAELAKDIRLNCTGLDKNDNDFVIGLIGKDLFPLSALVQTMRPTQQTSKYIQSMGPFFVGRAVWQSAP
ncbi:MAG: chlorite dismutase family protein [Elusimicrobia bacterium]|nr:chlorite dismutase family protein [Elusimicrobiota bacterium]